MGYPTKKPNIETLNHGWFWDSHREVIEALAGAETREYIYIIT